MLGLSGPSRGARVTPGVHRISRPEMSVEMGLRGGSDDGRIGAQDRDRRVRQGGADPRGSAARAPARRDRRLRRSRTWPRRRRWLRGSASRRAGPARPAVRRPPRAAPPAGGPMRSASSPPTCGITASRWMPSRPAATCSSRSRCRRTSRRRPTSSGWPGDARCKVAVGHQYRLCPSLEEARRRLEQGAIGPLRLVTATLARPWLAAQAGRGKSWRFDRKIAGGGILADAGDHLIDALLWTTGRAGRRGLRRPADPGIGARPDHRRGDPPDRRHPGDPRRLGRLRRVAVRAELFRGTRPAAGHGPGPRDRRRDGDLDPPDPGALGAEESIDGNFVSAAAPRRRRSAAPPSRPSTRSA